MFQFFPFTNAHQLNLDWILETLKTFPRTVNNTYPDDEGNINLPTVAGMSSWNGIGADGVGNVDPIETISDLDNAATGLHFYKWENPDTSNNPYGAAENTGYMTGNGGGVCISYVSAAGHAVQIANNAGCSTIAIRSLNAGDPWSNWTYYNSVIQDLSGNITLVPTVADMDEPYTIQGWTKNGWAYIYIETTTIGPCGLYDVIANGLPLPANPGPPCYINGIIKDVITGEPKPCRFVIDPYGHLTFTDCGEAAQALDIIIIEAQYPIA